MVGKGEKERKIGDMCVHITCKDFLGLFYCICNGLPFSFPFRLLLAQPAQVCSSPERVRDLPVNNDDPKDELLGERER